MHIHARWGRFTRLGLAGCALLAGLVGQAASSPPVLQVDYPFPTADKPQSKIWYADGSWWALLPRQAGPSLWQRTATGWKEQTEVHAALLGIPARADVWTDADGATAVSVADRLMKVFRLHPAASPGRTRVEILATLPAPASDSIETATIARDATGHWWVAATVQAKVYAWHSADALAWDQPEVLGRGLDPDDICTVTPIPGGVAVIWSNQKKDEVMMRRHRDARAPVDWDAAEAIARGHKTADDHLHTALAADGTLWVATKNSVDEAGQPQFVLRVRSPEGHWRNFPYARLLKDEEVSRPIVALDPTGRYLLAGHSVSDAPFHSRIVFGRVDIAHPAIVPGLRAVIEPDPVLRTRVNDPTGPKRPFPADAAWLVLASDAEGRVYEADLRDGAAPP